MATELKQSNRPVIEDRDRDAAREIASRLKDRLGPVEEPLTREEQETLATVRGLESLAEGIGAHEDSVAEWIESWGTENELPPPL